MIIEIDGESFEFISDPALFSPNHPDRGTLAMLKHVVFKKEDRILDLGCGWGFVGIKAAMNIGAGQVVMTDKDETAVRVSRENAYNLGFFDIDIRVSNAFSEIPEHDFTLILSNPPYQTDFAVPREFIEQSYHHLVNGGRLVMVTKRRDWYKNKIISVFGGVHIDEEDGYYIFAAEKREVQSPEKAKIKKPINNISRKLKRKYKM